VFCGNCTQANGKEKKLTLAFEPFRPLQHSLYKCGAQFHTKLLRDQLSESDTWGFIVIDGQGASFHTLSGSSSATLFKWDNVSLPKKHGRGGQSKQRFERIREQKRGWFLSKVTELALQHFIDPSTTLPNVAGLIVAGCADLKVELLDHLDQRLSKIVVCVIDVQYGGEAGFHQAIKLTEDKLSDMKFVREQKTVGRFFETIAQDGLYCIGVLDTMYALESGTVETVLVWDHLEHIRVELKSNVSGIKKVVFLLPDQQLEGGEWEVVCSDPLLDWMLDNYSNFGAALEFISDQSSVGNQFVRGFGGFGAFLRFEIPLPSQTEGDEDNLDAEPESDQEYEYEW